MNAVMVNRLLLAAFGAAALADLVFLAAGADAGHTAAKPLLMPLLAVWAARSGAPGLLVAALLCGWGGDVLLLIDADPAFLAGMGCFAAGHVCYLALFRGHGGGAETRVRGPLFAAGYALVLIVLVGSLWPDLPEGLRAPVAAYSLLLTAMACQAAVRVGAVAGLGGALFLLSDGLIAAGIAEWPRPAPADVWVMLTYIAAQTLLAVGVLGAWARTGAAYREVRPAARP